MDYRSRLTVAIICYRETIRGNKFAIHNPLGEALRRALASDKVQEKYKTKLRKYIAKMR